jgi:hypothetical protein
MAVTFPGKVVFLEQLNAGYSIFDNGSGAFNYFTNLTPASAFAADAKLVNMAWGVAPT